MKKHIKRNATMSIPIIFASLCLLLGLAAPVAAQTENFDQETYAQIRSLLNEEKKSLVQEGAPAQQALNQNIPNTVSCFDYYQFGSVEATVLPSVLTAVNGGTVTLTGTIRNNNTYPIVQGKVIAKIFKISGKGEKNINGPEVVDEFVVKNNISLQGQGAIPYKFDWKVPLYTDSGRYKAVTYFVSGDKFNLLGLTFTDDIIGNSAEFSIASTNDTIVRFDKAQVKVNGEPYYFASFPPQIPGIEPVTVDAVLVNKTDKPQDIPVTWKVYSWDAQSAANLIKDKEETINVPAKSSVTVSYKIQDNKQSVYYVVAEAHYQDTKSLLGIRFVRSDNNTFRLNFPAIKQYPLVKGQSATLFSCLHATNESAPIENGRLVLTVLNTKGKPIHTYTYTGPVTAQMMGVKDDFVVKKNMQNFTVRAELFKGDVLVDKADMVYSCDTLDPLGQCAQEVVFPWWTYLILLAVIILIGFIMKKKTKKTLSTLPLVVLALLSLGSMVAPHHVSAKEVQWNLAYKGQLYMRDRGDGVNKTQLTNPNITVTYKAEVSTENGEVLSGGENLPVGTKLKLKFVPHASEHIYWFGTGSSWDSPYGEWRAGAAAPAEACNAKDLAFAESWILPKPFIKMGNKNHYFPLVINPPTKSISGLKNISCEAVNADGVATCTVTGAGQITANFSFSSTQGKFYYRRGFELTNSSLLQDREEIKRTHQLCLSGQMTTYQCTRRDALASLPANATAEQIEQRLDEITTPRMTCYGPSPDVPMWIRGESDPFILNVPTQTINYTFNGSNEANQPPATPIITGPSEGFVGQDYEFGFVSSDPDGDELKYGISWEGDELVNEWSPSTGFVPESEEQNTIKAWSQPGTYTFKVVAQDTNGTSSPGWGVHTINIREVSDTDIICSASPSPAAPDQDVTWTVTLLTGNPALYTFAWTGAVSGFTDSVTRRYTDIGLKTAHITATGEGRTLETECTVNIVNPGSGCIPGSPGCVSSCGTVNTVPEGQNVSLTTANLCTAGSQLLEESFVLKADQDRWAWNCQNTAQAYPQNCQARCVTGTQYCPSTGVCEKSCDFCTNIEGVQSNRSLYDIDESGNCTVAQDAAIQYFRSSPDTSNSACQAYWQTAKTGGAEMNCKVNGVSVPESNPQAGGQPTFNLSPGRRHTLTCDVSSDGVFIKTLSATTRCYRVGEVKEN